MTSESGTTLPARSELEARAEGHTPTPWKWGVGQPNITRHWYDNIEVPIASVKTPAWHEDHICGSREAGANAAFIVLACNSYDALKAENAAMKAALENVRGYLVRTFSAVANDCPYCELCHGGGTHKPDCPVAIIDAALSLARGESRRTA